jgi:histidinol-phosphate aminotransferase
MAKSPNSLFRPEIGKMSAYKVVDAIGLIKLDAMENPYQWPSEITEQWLDKLRTCHLNRYPDPDSKKLSTIIRESNQIPDQFNILFGNGSDELIQMLLMALPADSCILAPEPSFVMYRQIAKSLGLNYHGISLLPNGFELDLPVMLDAISQHQPSIVFLAYPNNPTGNLFNKSYIFEILAASSGLVVVDEAYAPFADDTLLNDLKNHDNLLVMRTLSKLGLAGIRLGFLVGSAGYIEQLNKIRLPYNINTLTQISAEFALTQQDLFAEQTEKICQDRTLLINNLNDLPEIQVFKSSANFILFRTPAYQATSIFLSLKEQGILIKNLSPQAGMLADCLRVTVGKPEENQAFISALKKTLAKN